MRTPPPAVLLATTLLAAFTSLSTHASEPPPEASAQLRVDVIELHGDIHGGDGDGVPALYTLYVVLAVHNTGPSAVQLTGASVQLDAGTPPLARHVTFDPTPLAAGATTELIVSRTLPYDTRDALLAGCRDTAHRPPRRVVGSAEFRAGRHTRYAVFTSRVPYRDAFDPVGDR